MNRILIAALLLAAPAFAQEYPGDDWSWSSDEEDSPPPPADDYGYSGWAPPDQGPTLDDFRNDSELAWYGEWISTPEYGLVWRPRSVRADWQPYMYGRWAWTTAGWAWVSEEPFGWAVYHYGRWAWSPDGWIWVPGRVWAPAWVAWRWGNGYAGWCPLGPRGYVVQQPVQWVYVDTRHFMEPVHHHVIPKPARQRLPVPHAAGRGPVSGPPVAVIQQATGRQVRPLPVVDAPVPKAAQQTSNGVGFYRPRTAPVPVPSRQATPRPLGSGTPPPAGSGSSQPRPAPSQSGQPHAAPASKPPHPIYFGGVPAPKQGGTPRPAPAPTPAQKDSRDSESKSGQTKPHARER